MQVAYSSIIKASFSFSLTQSLFQYKFLYNKLKMASLSYACLMACLVVLTTQWWDVGHMLTAAIAQLRMNKLHPYASINFRELTLSINNLVDNKSRTFVETACWPDDIKGSKYNMGLWNPWHYIDKTYVTDGVFPIINFTEVAVNSIELVNNAIKTISFNINKTTAERALFARYLVHVVGDMHQPLHSVALFNETYPNGDIGGNRLKIITPDGKSNNFHSYWDAGGFQIQNDSWTMPRPLSIQNQTLLRDMAEQYVKDYGKEVQELSYKLSPVEWAVQSYKYALNTTYPHLSKSDRATQQYINLTYETSRKRITMAGYRLANLVISIYQKAGIRSSVGKIDFINKQNTNSNQKPDQIWKQVKLQKI